MPKKIPSKEAIKYAKEIKIIHDRQNRKEKFIEKARKVHGDKYDYSKVNYINCKIPVIIICKKHGAFEQTPDSHIQGRGCSICGRELISLKLRQDTETFIKRGKELYGDKYDYSKVEYVDSVTEVIIGCNNCGHTFKLTPNGHLNSHLGCPHCAKNKRGTTEEFIKRAREVHGDKYDYSKVNYINAQTDVIIICPKHGEFPQRPNKHINFNHGCPLCKSSNGEKEIISLLESKNIRFIPQYRFEDCRDNKPLPFDFYLPDYNVCIEYDGIQHFEEVKVWRGKKGLAYIQKHDSIKTNYCKQNNIPLLRIKYNEDVETSLNQFLYDKCKIEPQSIFDL